jgi:hypothetical protein
LGRRGLTDVLGKEQTPQPPLGTYFQEQISEHMVLLGSLLGDQGFQGASKQLLVPLRHGADDIDQQVSPGHGGGKAGVAGACGNAPMQVAAS